MEAEQELLLVKLLQTHDSNTTILGKCCGTNFAPIREIERAYIFRTVLTVIESPEALIALYWLTSTEEEQHAVNDKFLKTRSEAGSTAR